MGACYLQQVWPTDNAPLYKYLQCKHGEHHHSFVFFNGVFFGEPHPNPKPNTNPNVFFGEPDPNLTLSLALALTLALTLTRQASRVGA